MNSQALGMQRKIQNQRHSGSTLPALHNLTFNCTECEWQERWQICWEVCGCAGTSLSSDVCGSLSGSHSSTVRSTTWPLHGAGSLRQAWPALCVSEKGSSFISSLSSHARFRNSWEPQQYFGELPWIGAGGSQFCLAFWLTAKYKYSLPSYMFFRTHPEKPESGILWME